MREFKRALSRVMDAYVCVLLFALLSEAGLAQTGQFKENEIFIKFSAGVGQRLQDVISEQDAKQSAVLSPSLKKLNSQFKVKKTERVFKQFRAQQNRMNALQKSGNRLSP